MHVGMQGALEGICDADEDVVDVGEAAAGRGKLEEAHEEGHEESGDGDGGDDGSREGQPRHDRHSQPHLMGAVVLEDRRGGGERQRHRDLRRRKRGSITFRERVGSVYVCMYV